MSRLRPSFALALLIAIALLAAPAVASAAVNHPRLKPISGSTTPSQGFEDACGAAFGPEGALYVSDYHHDAVDALDQTGAYLSQLPEEAPGNGPCKIGLDAAGDLYVVNWHGDVVKYSAEELLPGRGTVLDSASATGLAIEQATGDVYVAHLTYVAKYSSAGALLQTIGGGGELEEAYGVAVSEFPATHGDLYVPDAATRTVKVFDPSGNPIGEIDAVATPQGHFTSFTDGEVAVDNTPGSPSYGHLFVLDAVAPGPAAQSEAVVDEFNAQGDYRSQISGFLDAEPSGIAVSPQSHNVFITSGNTERSQVFVYGPTAPAQTLSVAKAGSGGGTVVSSSSAGIVCGPACTAEYDEESTANLSAQPDAHSNFTGWTVTHSEPCSGTGSCRVAMDAGDAHVGVVATFEPAPLKPLSVEVAGGAGSVASEPAGIDCASGTCSEEFAEGRIVALVATPSPHNRFLGWSGCDSNPIPDECKVTMSAAKTVRAEFAPISPLSLDVSLSGSGQGTVTSFPEGVSCPGACSASFDEGSTVYLMAAPSPGSGFGGFSGGGCAGTATLCALRMSEAQSVTATFTGTACGPAAAAAAHGSFALAGVRTGPSGAVLTIDAPEAGTLLISGAGLRSSERPLSAGASQVRVALDRPARHRLARHHRLRTRLALGFLPSGGGTPSATAATLRFHTSAAKAKAQRRHR
jgi:hypothetical protein